MRMKIWIKVIWCFFSSFLPAKAKILTSEETVSEILEKHKSLIRFGDGEFNIYENKDIHYQIWSKELKESFLTVKNDFENNPDKCGFLLSVPYEFFKCSGFFLAKKRVYIASWAMPRRYFKKNFRQDIIYGNSFLFAKGNADIYSKLWDNGRKIIFIHNDAEYAARFSVYYGKKVYFIKVAAQNAFSEFNSILNEIKNMFTEYELNANDTEILISAGPCGKILAAALAKEGYWCIDTGHCWDSPLEINTNQR